MVARPEDILVAYSPDWTSFENQAFPLEAVSLPRGGAEIDDEDFTSSLRDFVAARAAAETSFYTDSTLVGGWFGGAGADPSAVILGVDWLTPPDEDSDADDDSTFRVGGLQSYYVTTPVAKTTHTLGYADAAGAPLPNPRLQNAVVGYTPPSADTHYRLELMCKIPVEFSHIAVLGDYAYTHERGHLVDIYRRDSIGTAVAAVQLLSKNSVEYMRACRKTNCVYVVQYGRLRVGGFSYAVTRIDEKYAVTPWLPADGRRFAYPPHFSQNGNILFLYKYMVCSYDPDGGLLNTIALAPETIADCLNPLPPRLVARHDGHQTPIGIKEFGREGVKYIGPGILQKENGSIVLTYVDDEDDRATLLEIDSNGKEVRKCKSVANQDCVIDFADERGDFMVVDLFQEIELLDPEFNSLGRYNLGWEDTNPYLIEMQFEVDAKEIVVISFERQPKKIMLSTYRFVKI